MAKKLGFLLLIICYFNSVFLTSACRSFDSMKEISSAEAIQLAEEFIKHQGYTNSPTRLSKEQIVFESLEWTSDVDKILKQRKRSLEPKAIGAIVNEDQWLVGFAHASVSPSSDRGRAVKMSMSGENIRVMHEDLDISIFKKNNAGSSRNRIH